MPTGIRGFQKNNQINKGKIPWNLGIPHSEETRKKIGIKSKNRKTTEEARINMSNAKKGSNHPLFGKKHSEETRKKISEAHKGFKYSIKTHKLWSEQRKGENNSNFGKHHSEETRKKISEKASGRKNPLNAGEKNFFWKGGITPINKQIRNSLEYKLWREAVFKRDNYQCIFGGKEHGSKLNADHIKSFSDFPELRFAIDNGRTLCVDCHKKTDNYGFKGNKTMLIESPYGIRL